MIPTYSMLRKLLLQLLLTGLLSLPAFAATEVVEVNFLPLSEAVNAVKTQLSASGSVAAMPSRRILVIDDDRPHLNGAIALLKRLDRQPDQYRAELEIGRSERSATAANHIDAELQVAPLPGGWVRISRRNQQGHADSQQRFSLRLSAGQPGSLETGVIKPYRRQSLQWLAGYGLIKRDSVEMIPITSGFHILIRPAGEGRVHLRITPWMRRAEPRLRGNQEMLIDLGSVRNPTRPPATNPAMRLNAHPDRRRAETIEITGAATELTMDINAPVTLAAIDREADKLAQALLSGYSSSGEEQLRIRLRISKAE